MSGPSGPPRLPAPARLGLALLAVIAIPLCPVFMRTVAAGRATPVATLVAMLALLLVAQRLSRGLPNPFRGRRPPPPGG